MSDSFYVFLPSNVKSDKDNKQSTYRTYLPKTLDLKGKWQVGLVEFIYPVSWNNIHASFEINSPIKQNEIEIAKTNGDFVVEHLQPGYYNSISNVIKSLNFKQSPH